MSKQRDAYGTHRDRSGRVSSLVLILVAASVMPSKLFAQLATPMIAPGFFHTIALFPDGRVKSCGGNGSGQLGLGPTASGFPANTFQQIPVGSLSNVAAIAAGPDHSLALLSNGTVKTWGVGNTGAKSASKGRKLEACSRTGREHVAGTQATEDALAAESCG